MNKPTPMMQQYLEIKAQYPDALLFYRMGDFYELFMEDAVTASSILEITLTSRDRQAENPVPMCGVPYHAADGYLSKLVAAGQKVAICDQVEDPRKAKGLVRREVTRVITPGLILEAQNLASKDPNYLAAISHSERDTRFGLAYLDISTAEFRVVELDCEAALSEELIRVSPRELLLPEGVEYLWVKRVQRHLDFALTHLAPGDFDRKRAEEKLVKHFKVHSLEGFGVHRMDLGIEAAGAILSYMQANLLGTSSHVAKIIPYNRSDFMVLDEATVRNLEIFQSASFHGRKGSLIEVLDQTRTAMGGRKLQQWLRYPLLDIERINSRLASVSELVEHSTYRARIINHLEKMHDIERLNGRNSTGTSNPRDLIALKKSLQQLPYIGEALSLMLDAGCRNEEAGGTEQEAENGRLEEVKENRLAEILGSWDELADLAELIGSTLVDPPPPGVGSGGVIRPGVHAELDHYSRLSRDAKGWMAEYEARERQRTGISSLKVRYNKVFGYYIEISKSNLPAVPPDYYRKQTLVNAERFITEELKVFETQVLESDEKRLEIEQQIFSELRHAVAMESDRIQRIAGNIAELDCLACLAETAMLNDYCRPWLDSGGSIRIRDGRHPVIEHFLQEGSFVPNDLDMDMDSQQILIITGPNMAGKSTILRQAALIVLMAQVGSFVPATEARIGVVDRIFTRVGASDDLARGRSTFMVEMQETANILHQATSGSLIILDEIGRGTSTFDGMSIAWAVAEFLHDFQGAGIKTLFATHYHELTELAHARPRVQNFNVAIKEWENEILFFHKLVPGGVSRSYGIQVARLAGLPEQVSRRAGDILSKLERGESLFSSAMMKRRTKAAKEKDAGMQLNLFRPSLEWLRERIMALDMDQISPLAALQTLYALKEEIRRAERTPQE